MKKGALLLILVLMIPLAQAFFPFTGFALTNVEEEVVLYACPDGYNNTGNFTCIPKCIEEASGVQLGNKNFYAYCLGSVKYEPTCAGFKILYQKTICPDGCKYGKCLTLERCTDNTQVGSCSIGLNSYCNENKEIISCKENEICRNGECTSSNDCDKNNGITVRGICPTGFIPSTRIKKEANTQCCIPIEQVSPIITIDETATCKDNTPVGKCSETQPYLCTHEKTLIRDCAKCGCPLNEKCDVNDPMVCTKIEDITAEFYSAINLSDAEKTILYAPDLTNFNLFGFQKNKIIPSYFLSPQSKGNTPTITRVHKTAKGMQIDVGEVYFKISFNKDGTPQVDFYI